MEKVQDNDHNQIHGNSLLRLSLHIMNVENETIGSAIGLCISKMKFW